VKAIIDKIIKEEEQARQNIDSAKAKATEIINEANKEAKRRSEEIISSADSIAKDKKQQTEKTFVEEKNKIIEKTKEEAIKLRQQKEKNMSDIADKVFAEIISVK